MDHQKRISAIALLALGLMISSAPANPTLTPGVWTNLETFGGFSNDIQFDPNNHSVLYTCGGYGGALLKSTDGGSNWTVLGTGTLTVPQRIRINPNNSQHLYVIQGVVASGFFVSADGGSTWTTPAGYDSVGAIIHDFDMYYMDVDPTDFNHILLTYHYYWYGGMDAGVVESFDGGKHCIIHPIPGVSNGGYNVFFLYNPKLGIGDNKTWLYCTQGAVGGDPTSKGFWRTTNSGTTWDQVTSNWMTHGGTQIYYAKTSVLYAAWEEGVQHSTDNGKTWEAVSNGLSSRYYFPVTGDGKLLYTVKGGTYSSPETDGKTWSLYNSRSFSDGVTCLTYDSLNNILYAAARGEGVWAMKLPATSTGVKSMPASGKTSPLKRTQSAVLTVTGNWGLSSTQKPMLQSGSFDLYDVRGQRISNVSVEENGTISVDRNKIGRQAVIIRK